MMKGSYILIMEMKRPKKIRIGRLGGMDFSRGFYAYVGSALNGLERRVGRHLGERKKRFWHIDYLLEETAVVGFFLVESAVKSECFIAGMLSRELESVPRFGCSDCRCESHLFHHPDGEEMKKIVSGALDRLEGRGTFVSQTYVDIDGSRAGGEYSTFPFRCMQHRL